MRRNVYPSADPRKVHLTRFHRPDLAGVRNHQAFGNTVAEETTHPFLVVSRVELSSRLTLDCADELRQALQDDGRWKPVEVGLEREARVETERVVVDERLPRLSREVRAEEISDEVADFGIRREQDVRAEVEDVPVDFDRARVTADAILALVHLPLEVPYFLQRVRGAESCETRPENHVSTPGHASRLLPSRESRVFAVVMR